MFIFLNELSKVEFQKLGKFVKADYFNSNSKLKSIYTYLESLYPNITEDDLLPETLWLSSESDSAFSDVNYRRLVSDFMIIFERFLLQSEFESDNGFSNIMLLENLRKRRLKKRFDKAYSEIIKEMDSSYSKDGEYYIRRFLVLGEKYQYEYGEKKYDYSPLLQEHSDNIDNLILFEKLHIAHQMFQSSQNAGDEGIYKLDWLTESITTVEGNLNYYRKFHPNIYIIYLTYNMFKQNDDKYMTELRDFLNASGANFPKTKLGYYYEYLSSYCLSRYNNGEKRYRKTALELYKIMDQKELLVIDNVILDSEFNNVVNVALGEKELSYAEKFIEKYKNKIDERFATDSYSLAKAKLMFNRKEYDKMFEFMLKVEYKDPYYYINSKILAGRAFIESNEPIRAKYIHDNLKQYGRTNTALSDLQKNTISIFLHYFNYLIKIQSTSGSEMIKLKKLALTELLADKRVVPTQYWFKEKLS